MPSLAGHSRRGTSMRDHASPTTGAVQGLQDAIYNLFNTREQAEFKEIINDYHSRRNLVDFTHSLSVLLDTPAKRHIIKLLKKIIPKREVDTFDQLMVENLNLNNGSVSHQMSWDTKSLPRRLPGSYSAVGVSNLANLGPGNYATVGRRKPAPSVVSAPAYHTSTLPLRGAKVIRRPMAHTDFLGNGRTSAPEWEARAQSPIKQIRMIAPHDPSIGLGFSIRGGAEHGTGIYVSYVDVGSVAEKQGLAPGDQILCVNGISFKKITHDEAARIVKSYRRFDMDVRNVGRVPGSFETHQTYMWVDGGGRTVSPPPEVDRVGRYSTEGSRKSGLMLLKDSDERKVNLMVYDTSSLGISIRGGNEFGLGIYITQVDRGSVAANGGLKVGDQILDVNGYTFLDVSHADAVKVLKSSKHLIMTVKDVGKLPYARTTYDHTQWIRGSKLGGTSGAYSLADVNSDARNNYARNHANSSMFSRGAGSQLMHNSMMNHTSQMAIIEENARQVLGERQRATLKYYLDEYQKGFIEVEALLLALFEVLDNKNKFSLTSDIRGIILPKDLKVYDHLIVQKEVTMLRSKSMESLFPLPSDHHGNHQHSNHVGHGYSDQRDLSTFSSQSPYNLPPSAGHQANMGGDDHGSEEEMEALRQAIQLIESDRQRESKDTKRKTSKLKAGLRSLSLRLKKKRATPPVTDQLVVEADVHSSSQSGKLPPSELRSPSEDSGVDINGASHTTDTTVSSNLQHSYQNNWQQLSFGTQSSQRQQERGDSIDESSSSYRSNHYRLGGPNAYSLLDDRPVGVMSSTSELDDSLHQRMDMFKTLPAQYESEMVHANIQTEGEWSHGQNQRVRETSSRDPQARLNGEDLDYIRSQSQNSRSRNRSRSSSQRSNGQPSRQNSVLIQAPNDWADRNTDPGLEDDQSDSQVSKPPKPPRSQRLGHKLHHLSNSQSTSQENLHVVGSNIPDIKLDQYKLSQSKRMSLSTPDLSISLSNPWGFDDRFMEPLTIVPPPPSSTSSGGRYKIYDIPLDESGHSTSSLGLANGGDLYEDLSPIQIVPPPPPMDSPLGYEDYQDKQAANKQQTSEPIYSLASFPKDPQGARPKTNQATRPKQKPPVPVKTFSTSATKSPPKPGTPDVQTPSHKTPGVQTTSYTDGNHTRTITKVQLPEGLQGQVKQLSISKSRPNLGIAIEGGANTRQPLPRIINIQPAGAAALCRELKIGDVIIAINGKPLEGLEHKQCAKIIAMGFKDKQTNVMEMTVLDVSKKMSV